MSNQIKLFIIDFDDFNLDVLAAKLQDYGVEIDSSSKTYKQKLFSQFIRHKVLKEYLKLSQLEFSINQNNKPYLESHSDTYFNISHTKNHIVMAVADQEVGVDIEKIVSKKSFMSIARRYFSECEVEALEQSANLQKDFYTLWTLKESQVKRNSLGIAYGLKDALFYKKANGWASERYLEDFSTFFYNEQVISICAKNIIFSDIELFKLTCNFNFQAIDLSEYGFLLGVLLK